MAKSTNDASTAKRSSLPADVVGAAGDVVSAAQQASAPVTGKAARELKKLGKQLDKARALETKRLASWPRPRGRRAASRSRSASGKQPRRRRTSRPRRADQRPGSSARPGEPRRSGRRCRRRRRDGRRRRPRRPYPRSRLRLGRVATRTAGAAASAKRRVTRKPATRRKTATRRTDEAGTCEADGVDARHDQRGRDQCGGGDDPRPAPKRATTKRATRPSAATTKRATTKRAASTTRAAAAGSNPTTATPSTSKSTRQATAAKSSTRKAATAKPAATKRRDRQASRRQAGRRQAGRHEGRRREVDDPEDRDPPLEHGPQVVHQTHHATCAALHPPRCRHGHRAPPRDRRSRESQPDRVSQRPHVGASVDLGSNSVHLLVAELAGHELRPLVDESVFLGLGAAIDDQAHLGTARAGRAGRGPRAVRRRPRASWARRPITFMGTEPIRRAADAARIVADVETCDRRPAHVLSHEEEAYLTLVGVTAWACRWSTRRSSWTSAGAVPSSAPSRPGGSHARPACGSAPIA